MKNKFEEIILTASLSGVFVLGAEFYVKQYLHALRDPNLTFKNYQPATLATEAGTIELDPPVYYTPPEPFKQYSQYGISRMPIRESFPVYPFKNIV